MHIPLNSAYNLILIACAAYQFAFHHATGSNALCACLILLVSCVCRSYALSQSRFADRPLHSLLILVFDITSVSGPLLFKSIALEAVSDKLNLPLATFATASGTLIIATITLAAYKFINIGNVVAYGSGKGLRNNLGFFRDLDIRQSLALFFIGYAVSIALSISGNNILNKIGDAFGIFIFAPLLQFFFSTRKGSEQRLPILIIGFYFCFLLVLGMAGNARETFVAGVAIAAICWLLAIPERGMVISAKGIFRGLAAVVIAILVLAFFERLSLAMLVTRGNRATASGTEMISLTLSAFFDTSQLQGYVDYEQVLVAGDYSETYVPSRLFSRLISTKFQDNVLYYGGLLSPIDIDAVIAYEKNMIAGLLPQPILDFLSLDIDKVERYTLVDLLVNMTTGLPLGGLRSGAVTTEAWLVFEWAAPLILALISFTLFLLIDICSKRDGNNLIFSPLILLLSWKFVGTLGGWGFSADSLSAWLSVPVRQFPQTIIAYLLLANIVFHLIPSRSELRKI